MGNQFIEGAYELNSPSSINVDVSWLSIDATFVPINWYGYLQTLNDPPARVLIPTVYIGSMNYGTYFLNHSMHMRILDSAYTNKPCVFIIEYTKTTDAASTFFSANV